MDGNEPPAVDVSAALPHVTLFGMTINSVSLDDVFRSVTRQIESRDPGYIVTPNVDHICTFQKSEALRQAYKDAFLTLADGVPVVWASRLLRKRIPQKISGSDLVYWLSEYAAKKGYRLFFLGAAEGVAEDAARCLQRQYPGLQVAGCYSPPIGFEENEEENAKAIAILREAHPDICFLALGSPKQETWAHAHYRQVNVPVIIGVGAALDFAAGRVTRAPKCLQRMGLEWTWRLVQEPRRLAHRYLVKDMAFLALVWREWRRRGK